MPGIESQGGHAHLVSVLEIADPHVKAGQPGHEDDGVGDPVDAGLEHLDGLIEALLPGHQNGQADVMPGDIRGHFENHPVIVFRFVEAPLVFGQLRVIEKLELVHPVLGIGQRSLGDFHRGVGADVAQRPQPLLLLPAQLSPSRFRLRGIIPDRGQELFIQRGGGFAFLREEICFLPGVLLEVVKLRAGRLDVFPVSVDEA
ncbi:MAG: hypothetical protein BWX98_02409 [Candidatus Aminicenantes bacterium ADurb.Bin147]|nr:MAG: hypothetical protein BWX98_02409 [Candidatus Aminicenantes bacterium ADurb.Bin147]